MNDYKEFKTEIGGKEVTVEVGKYAFQTNGHCIVKCGDTMVMVNTCMNKEPRPGQDFFPLSVDYEEKLYAVGKIPGGFKKREGRPTDQAILTSRLIDRPLRPLFPKGFFNDVTVVATPLSVDYDVAPEHLRNYFDSLAKVFVKEGKEVTLERLKVFLPKLSQAGSKDDMSIAGFVDTKVFGNIRSYE